MTIKELKDAINYLPDDMEVILQKDSEGNGYSPLSQIDSNAVYVPINTWSGTVFDLDWTSEDAAMEEDEWDRTKSLPRVLVLCPVN